MPGQAKILTSEDIKYVFQLLQTNRDRLIFSLGLYTGLRISEIICLKQNQLFTEDGGIKYKLVVKRLKKKNTVYSEIPIHPKLRKSLDEYKQELLQNEWLFPSSDSTTGHLCRAQAHNILSQAFKARRLEGASTHSMRRTCLTNMSRAGVPLRTVQEISGHSNLSQLQAYLEVDPEDKHRAINMLKY